MKKFVFHIEGRDDKGVEFDIEQDFMAHDEEEARRGVIYYCNQILNFYPRKIGLVSCASHVKSPFDFS